MHTHTCSKKIILIIFFLVSIIATQAFGMFDINLSQKPENISVFHYCHKIAEEKYKEAIKNVSQIIEINEQEQETELVNTLQLMRKNHIPFPPSESKIIPENIKHAIEQMLSQDKLKQLISFARASFQSNRIIIYMYSNPPIVISHKTHEQQIPITKDNFNQIFIDYDVFSNYDGAMIKSYIRIEISKIIKQCKLRHLIYAHAKKEIVSPQVFSTAKNQQNLQNFTNLYKKMVLPIENMLIYVHSTFDDLESLRDLIVLTSQQEQTFFQQITPFLKNMYTEKLKEEQFIQYFQTNKTVGLSHQFIIQEKAILDTIKNQYQQAKISSKIESFIFYKQIVTDYANYPHKHLVKYYVKAQLKLAEIYLVMNKGIQELETKKLIKSVANQSIFQKEKIKAKYALFCIYLGGFYGLEKDIKKAEILFYALAKQCVCKKIKAESLFNFGAALITIPEKQLEGLNWLSQASVQNDYIKPKINALSILACQEIQQEFKLQAIQNGMQIINFYSFQNQKQNLSQCLDFILMLLQQRNIIEDQKTYIQLITMVKKISTFEEPDISIPTKIKALTVLLKQNLGTEEEEITIQNIFSFSQRLFEKKAFIYAKDMLMQLMHPDVAFPLKIQSYKRLYKIIMATPNTLIKKELIISYFDMVQTIFCSSQLPMIIPQSILNLPQQITSAKTSQLSRKRKRKGINLNKPAIKRRKLSSHAPQIPMPISAAKQTLEILEQEKTSSPETTRQHFIQLEQQRKTKLKKLLKGQISE